MRAVRVVAPLLISAIVLTIAPATDLPDQAARLWRQRLRPFCRIYLDPTNKNTRVMPDPQTRFALTAAANTATITVQYTGFTPQAQAAFQAAVDLWQTQVASSVPIAVTADFKDLGSGSLLGQAGPKTSAANFTGAPANTWFPIPLANKIGGLDRNGATEEIHAEFNSTRTDWYFGTDGNPGPGKIDFESVVLHELGHGLGFLGAGSVSGSAGTVRASAGLSVFPFIYDTFTVDGQSRNLTNTLFYPDSSPTLAQALQGIGGGVFFSGPATNAVLFHPRLYTPSIWQPGSSYSHLDEATFPAGNANSLMTPQIGFNESIHAPGAVALAMFQDMGWGGTLPQCSYTLSPSSVSVGAGATTGSFTVQTTAGCAWTAVSNTTPVVAITAGASGTGTGTVSYAVTANGGASQRTGTITVTGNNTFTVVQAAPAACSFTLSPASATVPGPASTGNSVSVTTQTGCPWTATSNASHLTITSGASGSGSGTVNYSVFANTSTNPRSGTLTIAGKTFTVTQAGRPADPLKSDFDGDGKSDFVVWRAVNGTFFWLLSSANNNPALAGVKQWGNQSLGDVPLVGDVDGDGKSDLIVWRASTGYWFWLTSSTGYNYANQGQKQWGAESQGDIPMLGDVDGDGKVDLIVWRASTGTFFWLTSSTGYNYANQGQKQWGNQGLGDKPFVGDFDGDGKSDLAVWRASTGFWFWLTSSSGYNYANQAQKQWGSQSAGDVPMLGDIDGDGKPDLIVWRAPTGTWFWITSSTGYNYANQGQKVWGSQAQGDVPRLPDLDGDGKADLTVWRPAAGLWFWLTSVSGYATSGTTVNWGAESQGDMPIIR